MPLQPSRYYEGSWSAAPEQEHPRSAEPEEHLENLARGILQYGLTRYLLRRRSSQRSSPSPEPPAEQSSRGMDRDRELPPRWSSRGSERGEPRGDSRRHDDERSRSGAREREPSSRSRAGSRSRPHHHEHELIAIVVPVLTGLTGYWVRQHFQRRREEKERERQREWERERDRERDQERSRRRRHHRHREPLSAENADVLAALDGLSLEAQNTSAAIRELTSVPPSHPNCEVHGRLHANAERLQNSLGSLQMGVNNIRNLYGERLERMQKHGRSRRGEATETRGMGADVSTGGAGNSPQQHDGNGTTAAPNYKGESLV